MPAKKGTKKAAKSDEQIDSVPELKEKATGNKKIKPSKAKAAGLQAPVGTRKSERSRAPPQSFRYSFFTTQCPKVAGLLGRDLLFPAKCPA